MFLFTNAPVGQRDTGLSGAAAAQSAGRGSEGVVEAIREGAQRSGVGFEYMLATAKRESALNPSAKAASSSATGLYQFIEQTWLGTMKSAGGKLGLSEYADAITAGGDGRYTVADPSARQAILDLRRDPRVSAAMAGELTQRNRDTLGAALNREPTSGELYAAHVLGAKGAASLITTAQTSPDRAAAIDMPEAASANRGLFYERTGRPRSAADLYATLTAKAGEDRSAAGGAGPPELTTAYASLDSSLRSLFQTDRRQGAISEGVAKLWQTRTVNAGPTRTAPTYFPRGDASEDTVSSPASSPAVASPTQAEAASGALLVPLPPQRPAGLAGTVAARTQATTLLSSSLKLRSGP